MLSGGPRAEVNSGATGATFQYECYEKDIGGRQVNIYDTVGLNEADGGTVSAAQAIQKLYELMCKLNDGVSLLVYVMRSPRLKKTIQDNYKLFYEIFCETKVQIVILITGLEDEDDMDAWWKDNEKTFLNREMEFSGAACITAIMGKKDRYKEEFTQSREKVEKLILNHCAQKPWLPPAGGGVAWLLIVLATSFNFFAKFFNIPAAVLEESIYLALKSYGGMDDKQARELANKIHVDCVRLGRKPTTQ